MDAPIVWMVLFFVVAVILLPLLTRGGVAAGAYQAIPHLLTKAERSFFGVLAKAVGDAGLVFAKVRVADVITPRKGRGRASWQRAFNAISAKHFDFVICDPGTSAILLVVELDDASHNAGRRQVRDDLINRACSSAGVPLLRVKAAPGYVLSEIRRQALALMAGAAGGGSLDSDEPPHVALPELGESVVIAKAEPLACPSCGDVMVLRKAKSGPNIGAEFWGCSRYPKCRGMKAQPPLETQ